MAFSGPPWTVRSAWRSPSRLSRLTAMRPATGSLKIPVTTVRPFQATALGSPTFTDLTCCTSDGCMLFLLKVFSLRFVWHYDCDVSHNGQASIAWDAAILSRMLNNIQV